ncbi:MAG TPA: TRAP transporter small permease subunit [Syntrophorhabdaceae bacterium]|nr:TRAP transporter small permease subunit [Syntrophorhabdaceae bacterium]
MQKNTLIQLFSPLSNVFEAIAGVALMAAMVLTGVDIAGRAFGHPVPGSFELVCICGAVLITFSMPGTSLARKHVVIDLFKTGFTFHVLTRLLGIGILALIGYSLAKMAIRLHGSGETTAVLTLPTYPVVWAMSAAFFVTCLILIADIFRKR